MTAPRTVAVPVDGGGVLVMPCPIWCTGHDSTRTEAPGDFHHTGPAVTVTVDTPHGPAQILHAQLAHYPLSTRPADTVPYAAVEVGADGSGAYDVPGLHALADEIAAKVSAALRALADQLAEALDEEGGER